MFKSPANEFFSHIHRKMRKFNYFQLQKKNHEVQLRSFSFILVGAIGKLEKKVNKKFQLLKIVQVQLMSFYHINVKTIGKYKNVKNVVN